MKFESIKKITEGKFFHYYIAKYINRYNEVKNYELVSRQADLEEKGLGVHEADAVGMVVFNCDKSKILLCKEFRLACNEWVYNFPGGLIDEEESPREALARELREETGLWLVDVIDMLPSAVTAVGVSNEAVVTYVVTADGELRDSWFANEEIKSAWYTKEEVLELIKSGQLFALRTQSVCYMWAVS